jgi:hypothetical protein
MPRIANWRCPGETIGWNTPVETDEKWEEKKVKAFVDLRRIMMIYVSSYKLGVLDTIDYGL